MVKPQLNLEKKDDVKKPDGSLVKVITIQDEPAPIRKEPDYVTTPARTPRRSPAKVCCTLLCTLLFVLMSFMLVSYVLNPYRGFRCGVGYYDDYELYPGSDYYYDYWSSEGVRPYGNDMLFAPRPTGAPMLHYLEEGVEIDLELRFIRINNPTNSEVPGVSVIHDFDLNLSAYLVPSSDVCYIRPLNLDSTLSPEDFQSLLENDAYKNQDFPMSREIYTVDPNEAVMGVGDHIEEMCAEQTSYYIHSVSSDQHEAFFRTVKQVIRGHVRGSDEESGEHHFRRHGGSRHHGDRDSDSRSSSEETEAFRPRRRFIKEYFENVRSFDGQQVVSLAVLQTHKLEGLSDEDQQRLLAFNEEPFMP